MRTAMRLFLVLGSLVMACTAWAQVYTYTDENGLTVYTDRKPDSDRYDVRNLGCYGTCRKGVDWQSTPLLPRHFDVEIRAASEVFEIDAALVRAIVHAESWFEPQAVSHAGAQGLMQLMPATQQRFGVANPFDPLDNITAGAAYLAWLLEEFGGDRDRAIAAYNAGENAVRRHNGIPPFPETREYVRRVNILFRRYSGS
jgi:soluble lytic murein transglycosylase-like protein